MRQAYALLYVTVKRGFGKVAPAFATFSLVATMALGLSIIAAAATPPGTQLQIQSVQVDFAGQKINIFGQQFNFGPGPLAVSLSNVGTLTPDCTANYSSSPQTITCDLSGGTPPFPPAGIYLLTVSNGNGSTLSTIVRNSPLWIV
jgi:hypothetical protein